MTDANSKPDYSTLLWVKEGLEGSILLARQSLEKYAEGGFEGDGLEEFKKQLHQVFGTLKMVQVHGACMLVEEMEAVADAVLAHRLKLDKRGAESLMLGLVQLPSYLESLEAGHADIPLSLLPIINDLRSLRGAREASVVSLYAPNLDQLIDAEPVVPGSGNPEMNHVVRELRNTYQMGLLAWYKGKDSSAGLRSVHQVIQHINANAGTDRLRRLMESVEALVVVLEEGEFVAEGEVKALIGRVDRFLKRLIDVGEEAAVKDFPLDLLKNVLYFVAKSSSKNTVVLAVKKSADLANSFRNIELEPGQAATTGGTSHEIVLAVRGELHQDLEQIKDNIDLFIRGGTTERDRVGDLLQSLHRVADTLGMIGMGNQRTRVNHISEQFVTANESGEPLTEDQLLEIATDLLRVERALDRSSLKEESPEDSEQSLDDEEYVHALIKEAFTEFSYIKGNLEDYLRKERSPDLLQGLKENLEKLVAVFRVVNLNNISELLASVGPHVSGLNDLEPDAPIDDEALVDVFAGIEYYLEMLLESGANTDGVLDYSRKALARLESGEIPQPDEMPVKEPVEEVVEETLSIESEEPYAEMPEIAEAADSSTDVSESVEEDILDLDISLDEEVEDKLETEVEEIDELVQQLDSDIVSADEDMVADEILEEPSEPAATEVAAVPVIPLDEIDPEIFDIFMEEAKEELGVIESEYPKWRKDVESQEPIDAFRRSFHTLKGSGRMVGANTIGEFAWAVENLLNRVLDGRVPADEKVLSLMDSVVDVLPQLVEGQEKGEMPAIDIASIQERAFALAEGAAEAEVLEEAAPEVTEEVAESLSAEELEALGPAPVVMDETLLEIFGSEAIAHLEVVRGCIERTRAADYKVTENLLRAIHTLRGSSHLAEVDPMAELAAAMENYCNLLKKRPVVEDQEEFTGTLQEFHETMESILGVINVAGAELPSWQPLVERVQRNIAILEQQAAPVTEAEVIEEAQPEAIEPKLAAGVMPLPESVDLELLEIFLEEADELGESLDSAVSIWEKDPGQDAALDDIKRGLHTLKGGARLANLMSVGDFVHVLESVFEGTSNGKISAGPELQSVVREAVDQLHLGIETLQQDHGLIDFSPIMGRMESLLGEIPAETEESLLVEETGMEEDYEEGPESLLETTEWAADTSTVYEETMERTTEEAVGEKIDVDSELLEIFLEEAMEMGEQLESAYGDWAADTANQKPIASLLRSLHTLKGGARLASLPAIGDLVHALESLLEGVVGESVKETPQTPAIVRLALDGIEQGLDQLQQSRMLPTFDPLIAALGAAVEGKEWAGFVEDGLVTQPTESIISSEWTEQTDFDVSDEEDSSFIMDSQLLTDSELLSDSQMQPSSVLLSGDAKVLPFPGATEPQEYKRPDKRPPPLQAEEVQSGGGERVRVRSELLDQLVNHAGEVSIYRARLEQQNNVVGRNLEELSQTVGRLQNQVRSMEIETEVQILSRHEHELGQEGYEDFDPLEMDRYSTLQQLSRALSETINDLSNIGETLEDQARDTDTLLLQQARVNNDLQDGLLRTRMVPFRRQASRLERVVRQTASSTQKKAELLVQGADGEIDRTILNRIMGPLEHLLRNAVAHGIETPAERRKSEKPDLGKVSLILAREGADIAITISDDGRGLNVDAIKERAIERGLMDANAEIEDDDVFQFILEPGFTTATEITQIAGRGVGMDAVVNEIKVLGGTLEIESQQGRGSSFVIRLPFTLAITEALLVSIGEQTMAIPHGAVEVIVRATRQDLMECYNGVRDSIEYQGHEYKVRYMGSMLGIAAPVLTEGRKWFPVLLVRTGEHRVAIQVDQLLGNFEIVVKSIGNQLGGVRWFTGGTILADGGIALIVDLNTLVRQDSSHQIEIPVEEEEEIAGVTVMVVDDSITVRKVTSRLLERHNMEVITAKDGVDAVTVLQDQIPDVMLLDIEMPRMDGYELARHMRHTPELSGIPIIMITSRTGEKHRQRAVDLGVKRYLGKPYQEAELLDNIYTLLAESAGAAYE